MSDHPTDEALYAADPTAKKHCVDCVDCARRFKRLRAGAALIDIAARQSAPPLDWHSLDAIVFTAAEQTAQQVRDGTLKPTRSPTQRIASIALPLAMAASIVFGVYRYNATQTPTLPSTGQHLAQHSPQHVAPTPVVAQAEWDAPRVLFTTRSVLLTPPSAETRPLRVDSIISARAVLRTSTSTARAVIALAHGQRVDLRSSSQLQFNSATRAESSVELVSGEARVDVAPESGRVAMTVQQWGFAAKNGSVVAKLDGDSLKLTVLSGEVTCRFQGGAEQTLQPGAQWTLSKTGVVSQEALTGAVADSLSLDAVLARLSDEGSLVAVGELPAGAQLSFADRVEIPWDLSALRVRSAMVLRAEKAGQVWEVRVDPSQPTAPEWSVTTAPVVAAINPTLAPSGTHVRHATAAAVTVMTASTIPDDARGSFRVIQRMVGQRTSPCFDRCERSNSCGDIASMAATVQLDAEGRVTSVQLSGHPTPLLAACIETGVRAARLPLLPNARVNLGQFRR